MFQIRKQRGIFALISHISFITEIFQILLTIKKSLKLNFSFATQKKNLQGQNLEFLFYCNGKYSSQEFTSQFSVFIGTILFSCLKLKGASNSVFCVPCFVCSALNSVLQLYDYFLYNRVICDFVLILYKLFGKT